MLASEGDSECSLQWRHNERDGVSNHLRPTISSGADQNKQSSASLAFVGKIHRCPVNSPHKGPVTWKMFPFDDVIMFLGVNLEKNWERLYKNNWANHTYVKMRATFHMCNLYSLYISVLISAAIVAACTAVLPDNVGPTIRWV